MQKSSLLVIATAIVSYLVGSVSYARILTRLKDPGVDLTKLDMPMSGTGRRGELLAGVGANTAGIVLGAKGGLAVAVLDMLKGALPTILAQVLWPGTPLRYVAALAAVIGHNWPIYYRFRGGAGWSTAMGALLIIDPIAALVLPLVVSILSLMLTGQPLIGDLLWPWLLIPWLWWRTGDPASAWWALGFNLLIVLAIVPEARMLFRYRKLGLSEPYMEAVSQASPRRRGLARMSKRLFLFKKLVERRKHKQPWMMPLSGRDAPHTPPSHVGNKAIGIARLDHEGIRVPPSWAIRWDAHNAWQTGQPWRERLFSALTNLPDDTTYAVRSSANKDEDTTTQTGRFLSILNVQGRGHLLDAIEQVWASAMNQDVTANPPDIDQSAIKMGVLIQEMVPAVCSGIAFSCNPVTGLDKVVTEVMRDTGDAPMQDDAEPARWTWKKGAWLERPKDKMCVDELWPEALEQIVEVIQPVSMAWGTPIEMEWAWDGQHINWLQVREVNGLDGIEIHSNHMPK